MSGELVLVTGGSGFVGTYCILALLDAGYRVRMTLRAPAREAEVFASYPRQLWRNLARVVTPTLVLHGAASYPFVARGVARWCALEAPASMTGAVLDANGASYVR